MRPGTISPSITIAVAAMGDTLVNLSLPKESKGVDYVVVVQKSKDTTPPKHLIRNDVVVEYSREIGLSNSRNLGLKMATGDVVVFSDDDLDLHIDEIQKLAATFNSNPKQDFALGRRVKQHPAPPHGGMRRVNRYNCGSTCAPEFMIRTSFAREQDMQFDPKFGVGARFPIGEDYIFVTDLIKAGGVGHAYPIDVATHLDASTGDQWTSPTITNARKAVLHRVFGKAAWLMQIVFAARHRKQLGNALKFAFSRYE